MFVLATLLLNAAALSQGEDWLIIGSHRQAVMAVDRASLSRTRNTASVAVLMGNFQPETAGTPPTTIQYYVSDETFSCESESRVEHEVRVYSPSGEMLGTSPADTDTTIRTGSIYQDVYSAVCAGGAKLGGSGYATAIEAIRAEDKNRRLSGLEVAD
jgi:hypothetical protein